MIFKAKSSRNKPDWISAATWEAMLEYWSINGAKKRSKTASANRPSYRDGLGHIDTKQLFIWCKPILIDVFDFLHVLTPQNRRIFGVGGISTRERGESSVTGALGRITLERQVITLQEQLPSILKSMKQYMANGASNFPLTQRRQGTDASVTNPECANNNMETQDADHDQDGVDIDPPIPHVEEEHADHDPDGEEYEGGAGF
ncbi:hypothetical protein ISN44_As04g007400 [Arabidopsis suecica]|uniref:Uncharacterized protein n=1 Tax=Arabidopsis suecica TaxID=45249 RepID=A0A8T2E6N8_ARASU|nr:hypothetical protein ISN44_As04g007400 [Arabidopsis suecica]